jgi:8-amino-7-oxononanoate synthase
MNVNDFYKSELTRLGTLGLKRELVAKDALTVENLSSNDYLNLSVHPDVIAAAVTATQQFGVGGVSSRLLAGTLTLHSELEQQLAAYTDKQAALVFSSGYHVNTGLIPALAGHGDAIFVDRLCHASIIDGVRLSGARFYTFDHNDMADLAALLKDKRDNTRNALVISESIFSMDGDVARVAELAELAHEHDALFYLDEAHAFGVWGEAGRGVAAQAGVLDQVDLYVGTLSKTLGSMGGFVAGDQTLIDYFKSRARSFIYTTALAPSAVAAGLAALKILPGLDDRRQAVLNAAAELRASLKDLGYDTMKSQSQIVPVLTGDVAETKRLSDHLFAQGFFVPSIRPPTVPVGEARVRISITYEAALKNLRPLVDSFQNFGGRAKEVTHHIVKTH